MDTVPNLQPIPHPPGHLVVGNLFDLDASHPIESLVNLAHNYGPIFQIEIPGRGKRVIVSGYHLVDELCDESRFEKMLGPGLKALAKSPVGRGLFTSEPRIRSGARPITCCCPPSAWTRCAVTIPEC
jgi:cytochrome P450/NADPH-cytochrome P450 reductase